MRRGRRSVEIKRISWYVLSGNSAQIPICDFSMISLELIIIALIIEVTAYIQVFASFRNMRILQIYYILTLTFNVSIHGSYLLFR